LEEITETSGLDLAWLVGTLEQAHSQEQTRVVDYLEAIADDVVFEMEMAARRASLLSKAK
jgi:hypothetical protein